MLQILVKMSYSYEIGYKEDNNEKGCNSSWNYRNS